MPITGKRIYILLWLILVAFPGLLNARTSQIRDVPKQAIWVPTAIFAGYYSYEWFLKEKWGPHQPRWQQPNGFDSTIRNWLKWNDSSLKKAALLSDILLFGVFASSIIWSPFLIESGSDDFRANFTILAETAAVTSLFNLLVKVSFARQRPYSYYNTSATKGVDDNLSFFSGHAAFSFSVATAFAILYAEYQPQYAAAGYSTAYTLAAATAYLRVAADKHYFSDVLTGALIGSAIGWLYTKYRYRREASSLQSGSQSMYLSLYTGSF